MMYGSFLYVLFHEANVINVIIKNALLHVKNHDLLYLKSFTCLFQTVFGDPSFHTLVQCAVSQRFELLEGV